MPILPEDERFLDRALTLAREAAAFASPNPTVGCVLVRDGEVLGEGAHRYDALDHAEVVALKQSARRELSTRGATAYVTLEPCSHHGRTGPCADALIAARIARCVVATVDPNPEVSGRGIARMRVAGIAAEVLDPSSILARKARRLNDAFAFSIRRGRPFVTLKSAVSVDGMIAPAERAERTPVWLTGEAARADVQRLRHGSDAVVTGVGTVLADDPSLTDRSGLPRRRTLLRVVLDSHLRTPLDSKLVTSAHGDVLMIASEAAPGHRVKALRERGVEVVTVEERDLQPEAVLEILQQRSIRSVLLEAGSRLNGAFLMADAVDRVVLYVSEVELGQGGVPFAAGGGSPYTLMQRLTKVAREAFPHGAPSTLEDVRLSGYLHDPWLDAPRSPPQD